MKGNILVLRLSEFVCHKHLQLLFSPDPEIFCFGLHFLQTLQLLDAALLAVKIHLSLALNIFKTASAPDTQVFIIFFNFQIKTFDCVWGFF